MPRTVTYTVISGFALRFQGRQVLGQRSGCAQHNGGEENLHNSAILRNDSLDCDGRAPTWSARQMTRMRVLLSILRGRYAKDAMRFRVVGFAKRRWWCEKEERRREEQMIIKGMRHKPARYFCYTMSLIRQRLCCLACLGGRGNRETLLEPHRYSLSRRSNCWFEVPAVEGSREMRSSDSPVATSHVPC